MNTMIQVGQVLSVCHADCFEVCTEIYRGTVLRIEDAGEVFPYAKDPVYAFVLNAPFPSAHLYPPKQDYADRIFRYGDDGSFVYIDDLGQPRHLEVELCALAD